ncbi:hypothetical protein K7432_007896 [Basidiobolus ranarum]|uniref:Peptidase M20 dimerisation domain-containing protein n=1 Tax=Basidiobolus ranarum TaxID=34480 RepID=A0ABR2WSU6_9FUNG
MSLESLFKYIDQHKKDYIERLAEIVAIPSVSAEITKRQDVVRMGEWLKDELERLGAKTKRVDPGMQSIEGQEIPYPPVILGSLGEDPNKKTVLVYGHYDVQPALKEDGWNTDPFTLTESNGRLYGRGSTDDKGPVLGWFLMIEAHQKLGIELPVNIKMCFEGMEESGSEGLDEVIEQEANGWFKGVDCVCISDNYWLGRNKPCLTYGLRGVSYFRIVVTGPGADLHSGVFGGAVHEPMTDLIHLMSKLVTPQGKILIPGIMDEVAPLTDEEKATYSTLDFSIDDLQSSIGAQNNIYDDVPNTLMARWRYPSLSLHGIEGAFYNPGQKTVIPAKVSGKFSIRTVPDMTVEKVTEIVSDYIKAEFGKLDSKNQLFVECMHAGRPWMSSPNHWNYVAGAQAVKKVFGLEPDLTREGCSIPVTLTFQEVLQKNVLLLPVGACDDGAHSINEKLNVSNYIEGIKLLGAYCHELATVKKTD